MKKSMIFVGMLCIGYANAQEGNVGINTENPRAILEVTPSTSHLTGTTNEGIIAPNLSKTRIANIATPVEGTLVYATDAVYTAGTDTTKNNRVAKITEKGYYFYNGTEWVKASAGADTNTNIYISNGTLSGHRTVDMAGKNLFFTNNGRIGIGTTAPSSALTIEGTGGWNDDISINTFGDVTGGFTLYTNKYRGTFENKTAVEVGDSLGNLNFRGYNGTAIANGVAINTVVSEVEGNNIKANLIINPTKNVGIGNGTPRARLDVYNSETNLDIPIFALGTRNNINNNVSKGMEFYTDNSNFPAAIDVVRGGSSGFTGLSFVTSQGAADTRTEKMRIQPNGNVGVGTIAPDNKLHVKADANPLKLEGLQADANATKILVADANGVVKTIEKSSLVSAPANTNAVQVGSTANMACNADNRGKMNFIQGENGKSDIFGVCMKNKDGNYYWAYWIGGNNPTTGSGNFGSGL